MRKEEMVNELMERMDAGKFESIDPDTILADLVDEVDMEIDGLSSSELFKIWKKSTDKKSIEDAFYLFTDMTFEDYLDKCMYECIYDFDEADIFIDGVPYIIQERDAKDNSNILADLRCSYAKAEEALNEIKSLSVVNDRVRAEIKENESYLMAAKQVVYTIGNFLKTIEDYDMPSYELVKKERRRTK